ncbi:MULTISPECIES: hypothetical protein [Vibrio]|uniref:Uncharacterized protein n=1 Tax=Vibrio kanaloae TaxID=170673 RepID=A0A4U1YZ12_9VIBR|nr:MULTISPECIES: hypothetical protein [Vibrio]EHC9869123.1 hypothetical protein [Vibrio alginolyticus]MCR9366262.1 hypothetical protein [Vibrio antiquarius]MCS0073770.1 hypothetical protein [Vibrio alginolyticus]TKF26945.1 hypothetical protein FCV50_20365 [Vibrio kanaloae]
MAKTHFHSNSRQRWFKPSVSMGLKGAQYSSIAASRVCPQFIVLAGAVGFISGAVIGGVLDELDAL